MDPNACLLRLMGALRDMDDEVAAEAAGDLLLWLLSGGALPSIPELREAIGIRPAFGPFALLWTGLVDRTEARS